MHDRQTAYDALTAHARDVWGRKERIKWGVVAMAVALWIVAFVAPIVMHWR